MRRLNHIPNPDFGKITFPDHYHFRLAKPKEQPGLLNDSENRIDYQSEDNSRLGNLEGFQNLTRFFMSVF
jgi:hypothetical protein